MVHCEVASSLVLQHRFIDCNYQTLVQRPAHQDRAAALQIFFRLYGGFAKADRKIVRDNCTNLNARWISFWSKPTKKRTSCQRASALAARVIVVTILFCIACSPVSEAPVIEANSVTWPA